VAGTGANRDLEKLRLKMVEKQIEARGIRDRRVLEAMRMVPRHLFVEEALAGRAYTDSPLPIGNRQTISQPYIVALMTEALELKGHEKVLEIGTGCGYQTAILAELAERVFSIERIKTLAFRTQELLQSLKYYNVLIKVFDGTYGWKEESPFDAIMVTAGAPGIPEPLVDQLADGGRMIIPIGGEITQDLIRIRKRRGKVREENLGGCRFVKLVGRHGWGNDDT